MIAVAAIPVTMFKLSFAISNELIPVIHNSFALIGSKEVRIGNRLNLTCYTERK